MQESPLLRAALAYASKLLWPVHPLKPRGKEALSRHGFKDATIDQDVIREWWTQHPEANIGIPTGVIFWALDVDPRNGGAESLERLTAKHGQLADTITQVTGGGGNQYLYAVPDQQRIGCHTNVWPGIDVKGEGGYIVVPPSIHPSGNAYAWDTIKKSILEETINPADSWLIAAILAATNHNHAPFALSERIPKGTQHKTLFQMGSAMRAKGCGYDEILESLWTVNNRRCEEPGPRKNIEKLARSIIEQYPPGSSVSMNQPPPPPKEEKEKPIVLPESRSVEQVLALDVAPPEQLVEGVLPRRGLALMTGAQRSGKTIFGAQLAIALARNQALFGYYPLCAHGPVIVMEKDDPGGDASFKDLYLRAQVPRGTPIEYYGPDRIPITLGQGFCEWLDIIIPRSHAVMVLLDSYTALRADRRQGGDIVQEERRDISQLDALAKRLGCLILLLHHESITTRSNGTLDWDARGAGTYGMSMAAECQIAITRYRELETGAPERFLRFRSRHLQDLQLTVRYEVKTGLFAFVLDGGAAPLYPLIYDIRKSISTDNFTAKDLEEPLGISRATSYRYLTALKNAGAVWRTRGGSYRLAPEMEQLIIPGLNGAGTMAVPERV